jgi:hypothetical protein
MTLEEKIRVAKDTCASELNLNRLYIKELPKEIGALVNLKN